MADDAAAPDARSTILQAGRRKAYRPLRVAEREAAVRAALDAWERGDWFETHELLEPAWMGSAELAERLRYQAVIKLAAAFVHLARGNRAGVRANLVGARARALEAGPSAVDLVAAIDALIADVEGGGSLASLSPLPLRDLLRR